MHICMNYVYKGMYVHCLLYITYNFYSFLDGMSKYSWLQNNNLCSIIIVNIKEFHVLEC